MAQEIDPVCGMLVEAGGTSHKVVYRGKVYYFCSVRCKRAFEADPERYLREGAKGMPE